MNAASASLLGRQDRIWPAVLASALVHVAFGAWALSRGGGSEYLPTQKPIVAKLVRLGPKKPESFLPRKEEAPPPPASAPAPSAVPTPGAKAAPALPGAKAKATPSPKAAAGGKVGGDPLARVMSRLERERADEAPRWGDPTGDAEGDAAEAGEGDRYLALAQRALRANFTPPATIAVKDRLHLRTIILILVEPNGVIRDARITRGSGNDVFDASALQSARATRLPPPPEQFKDRYRRDGIVTEFTP